MKLVRHQKLVVATYVSGPGSNLLGLDFADVDAYERDLADEPARDTLFVESVRLQVSQAVQEHIESKGTDPGLTGIVYLSTDNPSGSVYRRLASEILASLSNLNGLETFEPTWLPSDR